MRGVCSVRVFLVAGITLAIAACGGSDAPPSTVGGTVTGLSGSVALTNNGSGALTVSSNGAFTFSTPLPPGSAYAVAVQTQPSGQTCSVSNGSGTMGTINVTSVAVVCDTHTYATGGTVSGLTGTVVLQNNGGDDKTLSSDGDFTFTTRSATGSPYAVTVQSQPSGQTCTVTNDSGTIGSADISNVAVVCGITTYSTGGAISGLTGTVVLQNNGADAQTFSTDGAFTFPTAIAEGGAYAVTVQTQPIGQTCSVNDGSGTMGAADITNVAVICSANAYTTGGTVAGLTGTVVLQNNGADDQTINNDGLFTFPTPVAYGGNYAVTVQTQPATQTCSVTNSAGPIGAANVTDVAVICSTNAYTVGGTVSGLSGTVILQNNGADNLAINANGSATFPIPVAEGGTYNVTVQTQPAAQTCVVNNGSGTMGGANVTNLSLTCVDNTTTLSVTSTGVIPVNTTTGTVTVTNIGSSASAYNVSATLPGGWTSVIQDASTCSVVAPGASCTLSFSSTTPYVAQGNITITGDNVDTPPTMALAFSLDGYLIYAVTGSTVRVIASSDAASDDTWDGAHASIAGINENSTVGGGAACDGLTDGMCNTAQIVAHYSTPYSDYAAGKCYGITADNSGTVSLGTWYLPAICELAPSGLGQGANCPGGLANVNSNLESLGFGAFTGRTWSSTQFSGNPTNIAWEQDFDFDNQGVLFKHLASDVRCTREISY